MLFDGLLWSRIICIASRITFLTESNFSSLSFKNCPNWRKDSKTSKADNYSEKVASTKPFKEECLPFQGGKASSITKHPSFSLGPIMVELLRQEKRAVNHKWRKSFEFPISSRDVHNPDGFVV